MSKITFKGGIEVFKCGVLLFIAYNVFLIREEFVWIDADDLTVKVVNEYQKPLPVEIRGVTTGVTLPVGIDDSDSLRVFIMNSDPLRVGIWEVTTRDTLAVDIRDSTTIPVKVKNILPIQVKGR